ncbi:MAG: hypothetical protein Q4C79_06190, partial [Neisseria sp.]|uniref:hypothetical protein n=1 Tax=Neisseria sp. TaxID=192066 RepID=UPI0026DC3B7B
MRNSEEALGLTKTKLGLRNDTENWLQNDAGSWKEQWDQAWEEIHSDLTEEWAEANDHFSSIIMTPQDYSRMYAEYTDSFGSGAIASDAAVMDYVEAGELNGDGSDKYHNAGKKALGIGALVLGGLGLAMTNSGSKGNEGRVTDTANTAVDETETEPNALTAPNTPQPTTPDEPTTSEEPTTP